MHHELRTRGAGLGRRIGITIGALLVFRFGTFIPIPGIDAAVWRRIFEQDSGNFLGTLNWFSGGGIGRLSVLSLGLVPFVSAALLLQLASIVLPSLRALPRRGEDGRRRLDLYTLVLTIAIATFQAAGITLALEGVDGVIVERGTMFRMTTVLSLVGGVIFLVWLAGRITAHGLGNGVALILAVGIVVELPALVAGVLELVRMGLVSANLVLGVCLLAVALTALVVHMELARRQLEITFPPRQVGLHVIEGRSQLQLKLNSAGMVPTILASWLLLLPVLVANINIGLALPGWITAHLAQGRLVFLIVYGVAILLCVFFYTAFLLNPDEIAEDLRRHGGVIAGVEPGEATADRIDHVVSRVSAMGAVYLALVYLVPEILVANWSVPFYLGGTSLLILVCAILDLKAQLGRPRGEGLEAR